MKHTDWLTLIASTYLKYCIIKFDLSIFYDAFFVLSDVKLFSLNFTALK